VSAACLSSQNKTCLSAAGRSGERGTELGRCCYSSRRLESNPPHSDWRWLTARRCSSPPKLSCQAAGQHWRLCMAAGLDGCSLCARRAQRAPVEDAWRAQRMRVSRGHATLVIHAAHAVGAAALLACACCSAPGLLCLVLTLLARRRPAHARLQRACRTSAASAPRMACRPHTIRPATTQLLALPGACAPCTSASHLRVTHLSASHRDGERVGWLTSLSTCGLRAADAQHQLRRERLLRCGTAASSSPLLSY
jgi:hypothetical protein